MEAVKQLCSKTILLREGKIQKYGDTDQVIDYYLENATSEDACEYYHNKASFSKSKSPDNQSVGLVSAKLTDRNKNLKSKFGSTEEINIYIEYRVKYDLPNLFIDCSLFDERGSLIFHSTDNDREGPSRLPRTAGIYVSCCKIPANLLNIGRYSIRLDARIPKIEHFFSAINALFFRVESTGGPTSVEPPRDGIICPSLEWTIEKSNF
jgi:lipopolysaccharide transport system ATP-binding protein